MAIFKYTLPSGATFELTAPTGTTQRQADYIFYNQVAAGTFVGYKPGDTLSNPTTALLNFGLTRLERGTAGVKDQAVLSYNSGSQISTGNIANAGGLNFNSVTGLLINSSATGNVANTDSSSSNTSSDITEEQIVAIDSEISSVIELPSLDDVPIQNAITQANFIQVTSNPTEGRISQGPTGIGELSPTQTQSLLAQIAAVVNQSYSAITQKSGVGKYGFNAQQLERAGYIKPGYAQMYCPLNASTQTNPPNFVAFMNSPTPWTGLNGVNSVNDILNNESLQNKIQQVLMQQSYDNFVSLGLITPATPAVTTPSSATGFLYSNAGTLTTTSVPALLAINPMTAATNGAVATGNVVGQIPPSVLKLGSSASVAYASGLTSLSSGAVSFASSAIANVASSTGAVPAQLSGLATGLLGGSVAGVAARISSAVSADVGALVSNGSKFGTAIATTWAQGSATVANATVASATTALSGTVTALSGTLATNTTNIVQGAVKSATDLATGTITQLSGQATAALNTLGKASQFGINFSNFSLSGLVSKIQPAAAFSNTVNRQTVDAAVSRVIGSSKIPSPSFTLPSAASLGIEADIAQAKTILSQAQATTTVIANQVQGAAGQAQAIATGVLTQTTGAVNTATTAISSQATSATKNLFG